MRRAAAAIIALGVGLVAAAGTAAARSDSGGARVTLKSIAFKPASVRIRTGQRVTWTWRDAGVLHNIHSVDAPRFPGATTRKTGSYSVRFRRRGTYRYECTLHAGMTGRIVVTR